MTPILLALFVAFWSAARWGRAYGYRSAIYMGGYHRGQDIKGGTWGSKSVPSLTAGRVVRSYRTKKLGRIIVVDLGAAYGEWRYLAYCHMADSGAARVGQLLAQGDSIGHMASALEHPGIIGLTWTGRHLHLVWTNASDGADVQRPTRDPRILIRDALAIAAPTTVKPFPTPKPTPVPEPAEPEEVDEEMSRVTLIRTKETNGAYDGDWTLETPDDGLDLPAFDGTNGATARRVIRDDDDGVIHQYRGFRSTTIPVVGEQWRRMYGYSNGRAHAYLARPEYIVAQQQLSSLPVVAA